jgi:hypothetical protein
MTQAREHARSAPRKETRADKAQTARNVTSARYVYLHSGDDVTEVPVTKVRYSRIAEKTAALSKVIANYADTAARAEKAGQSLIVAYRVSPDGEIEIVRTAAVERPVEGSPLHVAITRARVRGSAKIADILKGGDMLTAEAFGDLIGASHTTVNAKRARHELLGLAGATRGFRYPRWQLTTDHLPLPGLVQLFEALGDQPWVVYRFLRTAHAELGGRTALDALKAGQVEAVLGVASNQAAGVFS